MLVYHGTATWNIQRLASDDFSKWNPFGLFVTDTPERAARYANAQATREVSGQTFPLYECAAVVAIEVEQAPKWTRRSEKHTSLDQCEGVIRSGKIVSVQIGRPSRISDQHEKIAQFQQQMPEVEVSFVDALKPAYR